MSHSSATLTATLPGPWPGSLQAGPRCDALLFGVSLMDIAARFGTPSYVVFEEEVRRRCRLYRDALPGADIAYAGKAFLCRAMASWVRDEGLSLDVCSWGELSLALSVGFPASRILFHGNAKTARELRAAVQAGVGRIVVDNLAEIAHLAALVPAGRRQKILIRVIPDVEAGGHRALRTGGEDQKFGLSIATGSADMAVTRALAQRSLDVAGLHAHLGSQICSVQPYDRAARALVDYLAHIRHDIGMTLSELDLGGGHGIAYVDHDEGLDVHAFAEAVPTAIQVRAGQVGLPCPRLVIEPGRAISGPAGITLYRVLAIKKGRYRTFVAVDGGMSENPRPSLYNARYSARLIGRLSTAELGRITLVGRHCEAGDIIAEDVSVPADVRRGDVIVVPATGAYHHSMASTYNLTGRPPVIAVANGRARLVVRREELADLMSRDVGL